MKHKFLKLCILVISLLLLSGCGEEPVETEPTLPADAILPVMANKTQKSREIKLTDFTLLLPRGYTYGKVDYEKEGYTVYCVWQDKKDKEYAYELDADVLFYIYDGVDVNSPHRELNKNQAMSSMKGSYMETFANKVTLRNRMPDAEVTLSEDERYYAFCFTGNSGDYITTTYGDMCYPKTYYGIYTMEARTNDSDRQYYGFIFSNDGQGEIFKQSEYETLLKQIKTQFNIEKFYTIPNAEPGQDVSLGRAYKQLVADIVYQREGTNYFERGTFYNTLLYYIETTGRNYVRKNVDGSKSQAAKKAQEAAQATAPTEEVPFETTFDPLELLEGTEETIIEANETPEETAPVEESFEKEPAVVGSSESKESVEITEPVETAPEETQGGATE